MTRNTVWYPYFEESLSDFFLIDHLMISIRRKNRISQQKSAFSKESGIAEVLGQDSIWIQASTSNSSPIFAIGSKLRGKSKTFFEIFVKNP